MELETPINNSDLEPKKSFSIIRFFKRIIISIFIILVLLLGTGFVIGYYYQNEVKEFIIGELNKQLNTQVIVDGKDIDFTIIQNFPFASVDFKNIKALDATSAKQKDTLFKAAKISFQFNIVDVFNKNYHIKNILLSDAKLNVWIDKTGNDNYHFWKPTNDSTSSKFNFALEKIILKNIDVTFNNFQTKQHLVFSVNDGKFTGDFSDKKYELNCLADLFVDRIKIEDVNYLRKKRVHTEMLLNVDNEMKSYKFTGAKIKLENLLVEIAGNILVANDEPIMNIGLHGKQMDIQSVLSLIPNKFKNRINDYESEGDFYFDATVQGSFVKEKMPQITADFGMKNVDITQTKNNITLKNVSLMGHYFNGNKSENQPSVLSISNFSAMINNGKIKGKINLQQLDNPLFDGQIEADINTEELQKFIKIDTIETINGQLKVNATFSGKANNLDSKKYQNILIDGNLSVNEMNLKIKNNPLEFKTINGDFKFDNNDIAINNLKGNISNSDFELKGFFINVIGFVSKEHQDITVDAMLHSENLNLDEILANKSTESEDKSKYKLKFSEHINFNLSSEIKHIQFRKFEATNVVGLLKLKDKKMIFDSVSLSTMNGKITTSGLIDGTDSTQLLITCFSDISRINITKMFYSFENFGQTAITEKNIKGITTAKIQFASVFSPELDIDLDKLYAGIDMSIENGELNNVAAMKSLSRFIDLKELENIHFATLKNQIEIKNRIITIPKMEVKSSALNISIAGTHTFNNEINYKIKLSLNELLSKKAKNAKKENDEFGEVADDGLGRTNIFLSMTGTVDNPTIKYDSKSAIQNIKQDLKVEKQTLKTILKEEFGLFKKDTALTNTNKLKKQDEAKFKINWEEADKKEEKRELKKPKKQEEDDF